MRLMYRVDSRDEKERQVEKLFCESMKKTLISHMRKNISVKKLQMREDLMLSTTAIDWVKKPKHIDMSYVLNVILSNVECIKIEKTHTYIIKFKNVNFPNTYNTIDNIVRFLDKGNEEFPAMYVFSNILNSFENNINVYWKTFVLQVLHRYPIGKVLLVR